MAHRFVSVKEVADTLDVHEKTVRRWCLRADVVAVLTPGGRGVWRVQVSADGLPVRR